MICQFYNFKLLIIQLKLILFHFLLIAKAKRLFDEACCKFKGVPKECMGNCRNAFESISSRVMGLPPAVCDEYHKLIEECIVLSKEGSIYAQRDQYLLKSK